jgi:eukaryotic-like serine/threonine-protein kinase
MGSGGSGSMQTVGAFTVRAWMQVALGGLTLVLLVSSLAVWTQARLSHTVRLQASKTLLAVRDAAVEGSSLWFRAAQRAAALAANHQELRIELNACLRGPRCLTADIERRIQRFMRAVGFVRFHLADRQGRVLAGDLAGGLSAELPRAIVERAASLGPGAVALMPPLTDDAPGAMQVIARLNAEDESFLGALVFELPLEGLSRLVGAARTGRSAETYAFDASGRLLTESRFTAQLHDLGLLEKGLAGAALKLVLRDPGGDLIRGYRPSRPRSELPMTRMVATAISGSSDVDVDGYRGYRGVSVIGAWVWLPQYGIGIATECDREEAFFTLHELQRLFAWIVAALAFAVVMLIAGMAFMTILHRRVRRAEQIAANYGQYRIVRKLAEGGMGRVYLASHELLRRPAAIKLLRPDRTTPEALSSFEREVQITSTLTHPNTIAIYDYGRADDGALYYVMEYLEGLDLQRLVTSFGPLPPQRVIWILRQLCGSLTEAHAAGLVHRDIKPGNLLICRRGGIADTLKVLDFGVVHVQRGTHFRSANDKLLVGTPEYMAPELFESATQASPQGDLYAIGAVGYFLLTGTPPFQEESTTDLCMAHLTRAPDAPSERLGSAIDPPLEAALMACLAKRREARPATAAALASLLGRSSLANAWTAAHADAWWRARSSEIASAQLSALRPDSESKPPARVRPVGH